MALLLMPMASMRRLMASCHVRALMLTLPAALPLPGPAVLLMLITGTSLGSLQPAREARREPCELTGSGLRSVCGRSVASPASSTTAAAPAQLMPSRRQRAPSAQQCPRWLGQRPTLAAAGGGPPPLLRPAAARSCGHCCPLLPPTPALHIGQQARFSNCQGAGKQRSSAAGKQVQPERHQAEPSCWQPRAVRHAWRCSTPGPMLSSAPPQSTDSAAAMLGLTVTVTSPPPDLSSTRLTLSLRCTCGSIGGGRGALLELASRACGKRAGWNPACRPGWHGRGRSRRLGGR